MYTFLAVNKFKITQIAQKFPAITLNSYNIPATHYRKEIHPHACTIA